MIMQLMMHRLYLGKAVQIRRFWTISWATKPVAAPSPFQRPTDRSVGDATWSDEYSWMEGSQALLQQHLAAEERYHKDMLRRTGMQALQNKIMHEMRSRFRAPQDSIPERMGQYLYFTRSCQGDSDAVAYMRRTGDGSEQLLLNPEVVAADTHHIQQSTGLPLGQDMALLKLSKDQKRLAYTVPLQQGMEQYCGIVKDLNSGQVLEHGVLPGISSLEFGADGHMLLYTIPDRLGRPYKVMLRDMRYSGMHDVAVWEEPLEQYFIELSRTKDWRFLTININSKLSSEVHLLPSHQLTAPPRCIEPRRPGLEYFVEHHQRHLYLLTNIGQPSNYELMSVSVDAASWRMEHWASVLPQQRPDVAVMDMDMFDGWCVLYERHSGRPAISVLQLPGKLAEGTQQQDLQQQQQQQHQQQQQGQQHRQDQQRLPLTSVPLPPWALHLDPGVNQDYFSPCLRVSLSSPAHPPSTFDYHFRSQQLVHLHSDSFPYVSQPVNHQASSAQQQHQQQQQQQQQQEEEQQMSAHSKVPEPPQAGLTPASRPSSAYGPTTSSWVPGPLVAEQLHFPSADGAQVPVTIVYHAQARCHAGPLLLLAYGAYGQPLEVPFDPNLLSLLERGFVVAYAHVRGGGEKGRAWHQAGRQLHKEASLQDYLACIRFLVEVGYSKPGLVAGHATSAGGLLLGAALNHCPHLFGAAVLRVPFVDLLTAMTSPHLPLTVHEYEEWGDPAEPQVLRLLQRLCPYHNIHRQRYPPTLVSCAWDDARVPVWAPAKWVARLRAHQVSGSPIMLHVHEDGGHHGSPQRQLEELAEDCAFIITALQGSLP